MKRILDIIKYAAPDCYEKTFGEETYVICNCTLEDPAFEVRRRNGGIRTESILRIGKDQNVYCETLTPEQVDEILCNMAKMISDERCKIK